MYYKKNQTSPSFEHAQSNDDDFLTITDSTTAYSVKYIVLDGQNM